MPGFYNDNEYDLAGFAVGLVENDKIIDGSSTRIGDVLVGIPSSGLHSNGYSLARKICFEILKLKIDTYVPELGKTIGEELLTPTKIYSEMIQKMVRNLPVHGLARITGGGITDNIVRIIPQVCDVVIRIGAWPVLPIFTYLKNAGNIPQEEMMRTFNNGVGLIAVLPGDAAHDLIERLRVMGENGFIIGEIIERKSPGPRVRWAV